MQAFNEGGEISILIHAVPGKTGTSNSLAPIKNAHRIYLIIMHLHWFIPIGLGWSTPPALPFRSNDLLIDSEVLTVSLLFENENIWKTKIKPRKN